MNAWDVEWQRQHTMLLASGLTDQLAEAVTNMLCLYSMSVYHSGGSWTVRFRRHRGTFYYIEVKGAAYNVQHYLSPWLQACQEVEAAYGHKPATGLC